MPFSELKYGQRFLLNGKRCFRSWHRPEEGQDPVYNAVNCEQLLLDDFSMDTFWVQADTEVDATDWFLK